MASKTKRTLSAADIELHEAVDPYTKLAPKARLAKVHDLLARGADANARGDYGLTPLHRAVSSCNPPPGLEVVHALLAAGAKVDAVSDAEVTPLLSAIEGNDDAGKATIARSLELVDLLVGHGAKLPEGTSLADFACASPEIFTRVWQLGADPTLADEEGRRAVNAVVASQRPRLLALLVDAKIDLGTVDSLGKTPLALARGILAEGRYDAKTAKAIVGILEKAGAPEEAREADRPAPFPHAAVMEALAKEEVEPSLTAILAKKPATLRAFADALKKHVGAPDEVMFVLPAIIGALGPKTKGKHAGDLKVKIPLFHHGDFHVGGSLQVVGPFVVTGNLVVDGVIADAGPDSLVIVGGDIEAHSVITDGRFWIGGDIDARDVVYGHYNDHTLYASTIYAKLAIADEHDVQADVEAELYLDSDTFAQGYGKNVVKRLREVLVDDVFDGDEFESGKLFARLHAGERVFRSAARVGKGSAAKGKAAPTKR